MKLDIITKIKSKHFVKNKICYNKYVDRLAKPHFLDTIWNRFLEHLITEGVS